MEKLIKLINKDEKLAVGLMSGTSLDGIDVALVKIRGHAENTDLKLIDFITVEYDNETRNRIIKASSIESSDVSLISLLNFDLGMKFADAVLKILDKNKISIENLDFISSHGQTIYHIPTKATFQIGEISVIAEETKTLTIGDFRVRDVAAGGHGAPLVPYSEYLLYKSEEDNIVLQNIGGIGNATLLLKKCKLEDIIAFDTGPGNMVIDYVVEKLTCGEKKYDNLGEMAARGVIDYDIVDELLKDPYFEQAPPKTTGREKYGKEFAENLIDIMKNKELTEYDMVATVTYFTAKSIAESYKKWILPIANIDKVILGGGGSHNMTLIKYLKQELSGIQIITQEDIGLSSDAKEAIAFAILGNETIHGNFNNIPNVTGAKHPVVMGKITL